MTETDCDLSTIELAVDESSITLAGPREWQDTGQRLSYWWQPTTAAVALSVHLMESGNLLGKSVLDLGSGLGLTGIAAGLSGANVVFSDSAPTAIDFARYNASLNGLSPDHVDFIVCDWDEVVHVGSFDFVIGSEILYDYFSHGSLIRLIQANLGVDGSLILADRKRLCVSRFLGRLHGKGFECFEYVTTPHLDGFPVQEISIFELKPSKSLDQIT